MNALRRVWLAQLAQRCLAPALAAGACRPAWAAPAAGDGPALAEAPPPDPVRRGRPLQFPRDHGAHLGQRTEWWYATGWLHPGTDDLGQAPTRPGADTGLLGFQVTFFRSRTGLARASLSRLAPRQLLFAHAAVTVLANGRHQHDQRLLRWSEDPLAPEGAAATDDARLHIGNWRLQRTGTWPRGAWVARLPSQGFLIDIELQPTQPLLLQGDAGFSRKGPEERQASHYYSLPQLLARGTVQLDTAKPTGAPLLGRAWLDQEWSDEILHPDAVGWDWIGINLFDGGALTAFQLRRADGSALWAGGSFRAAPGQARPQDFAPTGVSWQAGRRWRSPVSAASYPVDWRLQTPAGPFIVRALADAQELDGRGNTGAIYWEGLSELLDGTGQRIGLGYLEMTGYAGRLNMG
jgi:predicted secreted hydrolase